MCNTRSNVYLQSMKTYTLSVNTLTRKLTSERHDNCASCLGLILPIWWVTPPPNSCLKCFIWRHICKVFAFGLSSTLIWLHDLSSQCWVGLILIYIWLRVLSSTAFTYSYVFLFESFDLSECDRTQTPSMFYLRFYLSKSYAFYWNCRLSSLSPCQQKTQRQKLSLF